MVSVETISISLDAAIFLTNDVLPEQVAPVMKNIIWFAPLAIRNLGAGKRDDGKIHPIAEDSIVGKNSRQWICLQAVFMWRSVDQLARPMLFELHT